MARIRRVQRPGPLLRLSDWYTKRAFGRAVQHSHVVANHRVVFLAAGTFELAITRMRRVDERVKDLAGLRAAQLIGCPY